MNPPRNAAERLASRKDAARRFAELDPNTRDRTYDGSAAGALERHIHGLLLPIDDKNESED